MTQKHMTLRLERPKKFRFAFFGKATLAGGQQELQSKGVPATFLCTGCQMSRIVILATVELNESEHCLNWIRIGVVKFN